MTQEQQLFGIRAVPLVAADNWAPARVERGRALLMAVLREFPAGSSWLADLARWRVSRRDLQEMKAAARRIDVSWRQVLLANISYDLAMHTFGCSTAAIATPDGPVLARNLDWWPEPELIASAERVRHGHVLCATFPGFSGAVTGLSDRGFAIALNAVGCPERGLWRGRPVLLFLRSVLEQATDFADAVERLAQTRLAAPGLFTVVGVRNDERVVIERTPTRHALRRPVGDDALVATNDYRQLDADQVFDHSLYATACGRFNALSTLLEGRHPSTDAELLACLRHPRVRQQITVQHVVARPALGALHAWVPA